MTWQLWAMLGVLVGLLSGARLQAFLDTERHRRDAAAEPRRCPHCFHALPDSSSHPTRTDPT